MKQKIFSRNGKISEKQLRRMLMLTTFAGTIFIIPHLSAKLFKGSVFTGLIIFLLFSIIYISAIYGIGYLKQLKQEEDSSLDESEKQKSSTVSKIFDKLILFIELARQILHFVFYIILSIEILGEADVPFMQGSSTNSYWNLLVVLPLIFVALYGANHNVEKMARLYEMIFWVIFIPFIIMILFGLREMNYTVFIPKCDMSVWKILMLSYGLVSFLVPAEQYLFLYPNLKNQEGYEGNNKKKDKGYIALIGTVLLTIILSLFILGIYGTYGAAGKEMVTVDIMRYIRLPLGVLERFDVLMVWFFMLGCFVLICSSLFYGGHLAVKLNCGKRIWWLIGIIAVSLLLVLWLPDYENCLWIYFLYGAMIDLPLSIILPLFQTIID